MGEKLKIWRRVRPRPARACRPHPLGERGLGDLALLVF